MKWYFKVMGGHVHVRVFMGGGKCGDLCFRNDEFDRVRNQLNRIGVEFIDETPKTPTADRDDMMPQPWRRNG